MCSAVIKQKRLKQHLFLKKIYTEFAFGIEAYEALFQNDILLVDSEDVIENKK